MMTRGYGRILNTSSGAALGSGISGAYAPSKSGIIGLTKDAAISGRPHGIHINAIMPTAHTALLDNHPDKDFRRRSEEHTSELQSLMRISYAVFCLKKKKNKRKNKKQTNTTNIHRTHQHNKHTQKR